MNHKSKSQSVSWIQDQYRHGRLELRPPFQRKPVWTDKQRSYLIESILMDIPVPEVYVQVTLDDDGSERFGVVDGQQRLRTILQFVGIEREDDRFVEDDEESANAFALEKLPASSMHKGKAFGDLTKDEKDKFYAYDLCVRYLYTNDRTEVEDVFKRLNKFTLPLKPQELRNATYHGPFALLSEKLADDDYWAVNRIITPSAIRRMADIEMMSDLLIGLLHGPQGGSAKILDSYYDNYEQHEDEFPDQDLVTRLFNQTLVAIKAMFPEIADAPRWGNRADFYSLFVALGTSLKSHTLTQGHRKKLAAALVEFAEQVSEYLERRVGKAKDPWVRYANAIEKGVNDRARRLDRHSALQDIILPHLGKKK